MTPQGPPPELRVCVTGMHRGGTSLVARLVNLLGVDLGPEHHLLPPRQDNPAGFWEHREMVCISDDILAAFGGEWHELPWLPAGWEHDGVLDPIRERACAVLRESFGGGRAWGWKDPRAAVTLPFWHSIIGDLRHVVCVRHPTEVARSLEARDGFPRDKCYRLWTDYTAAAIGHARLAPQLVVFYEDLFGDKGELERLARFLHADEALLAGDRRSELEQTIRRDLRHHQAGLGDLDGEASMASAAKALYVALRASREGAGTTARDEVVHWIAAASIEDRRLREIVGDRDRRLGVVAEDLAEARAALSTVAAERDQARNAAGHAEAACRELEQQRASLDAQLADAQARVQALAAEVGAAAAEAATWRLQAADFRLALSTSDELVAQQDESLQRLAAEAAGVRQRVTATLAELTEMLDREGRLVAETEQLASSLAAIQQSPSWRALEALRRARLRARTLYLGARGAGTIGRRRPAGPSRPRVPARVRQAPLGVNVAGYIGAESGMGEAVRASLRSLEAAGVPFVLNNVEGPVRATDSSYHEFAHDNPHAFNLVHLNADNMAAFARARGRRYFRRRYTVGYWYWELARFRPDWRDAFGYVDEVWVATRSALASIGRDAPVPVLRMPPCVVPPRVAPLGRAHFGLEGRGILFLFMFDVSSQAARKNPVALIRAFRRAGFRPGEATLVLKYTNGAFDQQAVQRLRTEADGLDAVMLDGFMGRDELGALLNACDAYVSLHRAEGFGLTMAEAMCLGKPVIATAYSGNLDYMTDDNSFLVPCREVPLERDHGPYLRGFEWAEPDVEAAARLMRLVAFERDDARRRAEQGRRDVLRNHAPQVTGALMLRRLEELRSGQDTGPA